MKSILKSNRKGNLNLIVPSIMILIFAAIMLVFGLVILDNLWDQTSSGTEAYTAANKTIVGMGTFADYWELIVLAIVVAVVISLLLVVFSMRKVQ